MKNILFNTVGRIIFEDTQNFTLDKNFCGKNFEVMDNPRKILLRVSSTWRQVV